VERKEKGEGIGEIVLGKRCNKVCVTVVFKRQEK
jgi:hypothetical protein